MDIAKSKKEPELLSKYSLLRILGVIWLLGSYIFIIYKCKNFWTDNEDWGFWAFLGFTFFGAIIIGADEVSRIIVIKKIKNDINKRLFIVQLLGSTCFFLWLYLNDSALLKF